jgi:5-methylcytosine-specific restriction enzyme subunit McrC
MGTPVPMSSTAPAQAGAAIPVQNIYHLLTYAWNVLDMGEQVQHATTNAPDLLHLLAAVLRTGLEHLVKRGLHQDYCPAEELGPVPRGKLLLNRSIREAQLPQARIWCQTDERTPDNTLNQLVKSTAQFLISHGNLQGPVRAELQQVLRNFSDVRFVPLAHASLGAVRIYRHTARYALIVHVCKLIRQRALLTESEGQHVFRDFIREKKAMARLFEKFITNFFTHHLTNQATVAARHLNWNLVPADDTAQAHLPKMRTDVVIEFTDRIVLIECKYYPSVLTTGYYDTKRVRSAHLYQLFAYQQHLKIRYPGKHIQSILLYPVAQDSLFLRYHMEGEPVCVATINLNQHWQQVEADLMQLIAPSTAANAA